jgi:histo-blood group ABO system transferase
MKRFWQTFIMWGGLLSLSTGHSDQVAVCITATGKYAQYAEELVSSCRPRFLPNHQVVFFIFTDQPYEPSQDVVVIPWKRFGWPLDSLNRTQAYLEARDVLSQYDWVFASDADMLCVGPIGDEILGETVGVKHPAFVGRPGTFETNSGSKAYVPEHLRGTYFAGGFFGGSAKGFFAICESCQRSQQADARRGIMAVWHDESHLNRYFAFNPPAITLSHYYCFDERSLREDLPIKYVARRKNHAKLRQL